ncbi:MAG TPA: fdxN element excision recombinase XisF [Nostocaceae cyanobacterium]|nr:fdxN element excision recombinase XisF [Nostocaceae cyanobacterium]
MPKIVGYARVSSLEQANNSNALQQQIDRLIAAGAEEIYKDVESGWKDNHRPQLDQVLGMVRLKHVNEVIVTRVDRLSRRGVKSFQIFDLFSSSGVILRALDEPFDLTTAAGRAMAGQLAVFAQLHSDQKAESVRHGWANARKNLVVHILPFGYRKIDDKPCLDDRPFLCLIKNQQEMTRAAIAGEIIEAFFEKRSLGLTLREINEKYGIQTFARNNALGEKKKGGRAARDVFRFSTSGLSNWLTNPILRGHIGYLRKKQTAKGREPEIYYDTHPDERLITEAEFKEIESILAHNKQVRGYGSTALKYPLSGSIFCAECRGACYSLSGIKNHYRAKRLGIPFERNYYFQCKNWTTRSCTNKKTIRMEIVENAVVEKLTQRAEAIAQLAQVPETKENPKPPELLKLESQLAQMQQINSIAPNPAIRDAITQIENQILAFQYQQTPEQINSASIELLTWAFSDPECWKNCSDEDKKRIYRELVQSVVILNGEVVEVKLKI